MDEEHRRQEDDIRLLQAATEKLKEDSAAELRERMFQLERIMCDKFRILREERGWSQRELAERLSEWGFTFGQSTIAKIEKGLRPLRVAEMYAFSHVFKMPPGAVFFMAYAQPEWDSFDQLTRRLASLEESRAAIHDMTLRQIESGISIEADYEVKINELVATMRRVAAEDPQLQDVLADLDNRYPGEPAEAGDGEHQAEA